MKLLIDWLKDFTEVKETPQQLAEIFTLLGAQVESVNKDVLDLEVTPNRPDWLSIQGLAREYAAYTGTPLKTNILMSSDFKSTSKTLEIKFINPKLFPRYSAIIFDAIDIKPSSKLIQHRLKQVGINIHNNIVDITNYVMIETGMPIHAFDADLISGHAMTLRQSTAGEKIETLDEKTYDLPVGSLVIEDGKRLIDLCGIKGGAASGISDKTKRILLHAVVYDPKRIRQTSKKIGLSTNASYRFERGVDQQATTVALERAIKLMVESCGGRITEKIDIVNVPLKPQIIEFDPNRIVQLLGTPILAKTAINILTRLGFTVNGNQVSVPSWRLHDVKFQEDLVEEVARLYGYNKLAKRVLKTQNSKLKTKNQYQKSLPLKQYLASQGFSEVLSYSLVGKEEVGDKAIKLANPLSPETEYLRTSLTSGLIKVIAKNPWVNNVNIFEIGRVFRSDNETEMVSVASTQKLPFDLDEVAITPGHLIGKLNKLRRLVYIAELPLVEAIAKFGQKLVTRHLTTQQRITYRPISSYPPVVRDIAIIVDTKTQPRDIIETIKKIDSLILLVELFDEFKSDKFGVGKKSLAFHIVFDDPKKTMNEKEVSKLIDKISKLLENNFKAEIR